MADALAEAQKESLSEIIDTQVASKSDIEQLKESIGELKYEIRLVRWMLAVAVVIAAVVLPILKDFLT